MFCRKSLVVTFALVALGLVFSHGAWASRSLFSSPPSSSSGSRSYVGWLWSGCWEDGNLLYSGGAAVSPFNEPGDAALECTERSSGADCNGGLPGTKVTADFQLKHFGKPGVSDMITTLGATDFVTAGFPDPDEMGSLPFGIQLVGTRSAGHYIVEAYADAGKTLVLSGNTKLRKSETANGAIAPDTINAKITRLDSDDPAKVCARLFNDDGTPESIPNSNPAVNQEGIGEFSWESLAHRDCSFKVDPDTGEVDFDRPCTVTASVNDTPQGGTLIFPVSRYPFDDVTQSEVPSNNFVACDGQTTDCGQVIRVPDRVRKSTLKKYFPQTSTMPEGGTFTCTYNSGGRGISGCELRYCNTDLMIDPGGPVDCDFVATAAALALSEVEMSVDNNLNPSSTQSVLTANIDNSEFILTSLLDHTGKGATLVVEGRTEVRVPPYGTPTFNNTSAVYKFNNREIICAYAKSRQLPPNEDQTVPDGTPIYLRLEGLFPDGNGGYQGGLYGRDFTTTNGGDFDPTAAGACP